MQKNQAWFSALHGTPGTIRVVLVAPNTAGLVSTRLSTVAVQSSMATVKQRYNTDTKGTVGTTLRHRPLCTNPNTAGHGRWQNRAFWINTNTQRKHSLELKCFPCKREKTYYRTRIGYAYRPRPSPAYFKSLYTHTACFRGNANQRKTKPENTSRGAGLNATSCDSS